MLLMQSGSNWWIDSVARFPGGLLGGPLLGGAAYQDFAAVNAENSNTANSIDGAVSNIAEEGEISPAYEHGQTNSPPMGLKDEQIDSNSTAMGVSEEIVAAAARRIGVIEAATRQHQATGVINFDDDDAHSGNEDPGDASFKGSLLINLLQNPGASLAATNPSLDRGGLFSLLAN